jgi:hypothetical protein
MNADRDLVWSSADPDGVRTCVRPTKSAAKPSRWRRADHRDTEMFQTWPLERRELLTVWLDADAATRRWHTLLQIAGPDRCALANEICRALLIGGWVELDERRSPRRDWRVFALHWRDRSALRRLLGLPDVDALAADREDWRRRPFADPRLPALAATLDALPAKTALRRLPLLHRLDAWIAEGRHGTRRQFAQFARESTKAVSESEWQWLDEHLGLAELGIDAHLPGLWLRAPVRLLFAAGHLDLAAITEPLALTPATLQALSGASGRIGCWRVVENRTSFEQAAAGHGEHDGVLWVPGFPGPWWSHAVAALLRWLPAPAEIACDPDPAGIRIALQAGQVWTRAGLPWQPWAMSARHLQALDSKRPLSDEDRIVLERLLMDAALPHGLRELAVALRDTGQKGEQEAIDLFGRA